MAVTLALVEMAAMFVAICAVVFLPVHPVLTSDGDATAVVTRAWAVSLCCVVGFYLSNLYDLRRVPSFSPFASRLPKSLGVVLMLLAGVDVLLPKSTFGTSFMSSGLLAAAFVLPVRVLAYAAIRRRPFRERVLVLGNSPLALKLLDEIEARPHFGYAVVGIVADANSNLSPVPSTRYPVLGPPAHVSRIIETVHPHRVIVALTERRGQLRPTELLLQCRALRIAVEDGVACYERLTGKLAIESFTPSSFMFSKGFLKPRLYLLVARATSLVAAVCGVVCLAPLMVLIAVAIKLESRGPALFVHERVGLGGQRFALLKFRTMHPIDHRTSEWVRDNGDRITRVGKWLRKFRLDELPQFLNILRGEMNLIGPRPHPVSNFELFTANIPHYALRAMVLPGITGWSQVRFGYANSLEEEIEKMRYDLYYIKHMSLCLDLRILFDTIKTVFVGSVADTAVDTPPRCAQPSAVLQKAA